MTGAPGITARERLVLVAACGAAAMTTIDTTVVNVALPSIAADLGGSVTSVQWVVLSYTLLFAVLMVPAGRLADLVGHERAWRVGATTFALASLLCAVAPNEPVLIAGRVVQGIGAAAMKPTTVALVAAAVPPERRGWALGIMGSTLAAAAASGPVIGSVLVSVLDWRAIFLVNLPVAAIAVVILRRATRGTPVPAVRVSGLDGAGAVLLGLSMLSGVLALNGTAPVPLGVAFAVLLVGLVWRERRVREPIVQLALFRVRAYAVGNAISVLTSVGFFAMFFLQSLYLQGPLDYAPLAAGALLVPLGGATLLSSTVGGRLSDRWGPRVPIVVGLVLTTAALIVLSRVGAGSDYASHVLPAYVLEGLGWGLVSAPLNALVIGAATTDHSAEAAGVMATLDKLGAAVGVALAGSLLSSRGDDALASELAARGVTVSSDVLGRLSALVGRPDAGAEAAGVLGGHAAAAADAMNAAFFSGFTATMLVAACAMGAALALSAAGLWSSLLSGRGG